MNELLLNSAQLLLKGTERNLSSGTVSSVVITGIVVVFIGLILLILFVSIYGKIFELIENKKAKKNNEKLNSVNPAPVKVVEKPTSALVVEDGIDEEVVAVITAAIAAMSAKSGKKMMLKSIKNTKPARPAWANAGIVENTRPF